MVGVSSLTACGKTVKYAKEPPKVEKEEKVESDKYDSGVFTTDDYIVTIGTSGFAEANKIAMDYTIENKSKKTIKPDEIFGFSLKIEQFDEPLELSRLNDDLAVVIEARTEALHEDIKVGKKAEGTLIFEIPEGKEEIDVQVKALDTKTNKSLGEYVLSKEEYKIDTETEPEKAESENKEKLEKQSEVPQNKRTGADDALDNTQKEETGTDN